MYFFLALLKLTKSYSMKKISSVSMLFMALAICLQLSAEKLALADLPPVVRLPQTMSLDNQDVFIDVNLDGVGDFLVRFESNPGASWCEIYDPYVTSPSPALGTPSVEPNEVLFEEEELGYYTTILNQGDTVGSTGDWYNYASIFRRSEPEPESPLGSNYTNGALQGFIGIHYNASGGMYYGWLPVQIDPDGDWVTIGQGVSGSSPGSSVLAGSGSGSAVPVPFIASILGFGVIGFGVLLKRRKK